MRDGDLMDEGRLRETEEFLHEKIPLTRAMEVCVESFDGNRLVLVAPLEPNHNHLGTAFGGSLAALATLAGYALLWLLLENHDAHVVIQESTVRYRRPVRGRLRAVCERPNSVEWAAFRDTFVAAGKGRLRLAVRIEEAGEVCVEFEGRYVAMR